MGTLSLIALNFYRRGGSRWLAALSLLLLTFAFFNYEFMPFIFTVLYIACLFQGVSIRKLWMNAGAAAPEFRLAAAALGLCVVYLTAYFVFAATRPILSPQELSSLEVFVRSPSYRLRLALVRTAPSTLGFGPLTHFP